MYLKTTNSIGIDIKTITRSLFSTQQTPRTGGTQNE